MLSNYLTSALRSLARHPVQAAINVVGLAIAVACSLFILLVLQRELTFERFHEHADRIGRLVTEARYGKRTDVDATLGPALRDELPEVIDFVRLTTVYHDAVVSSGDRTFVEDQGAILRADGSLFDVFSFPLLHGDARTALGDPGSVVLTQSTARRYFGDAEPLGRTLLIDLPPHDEFVPHTVTGVAQDIPSTSHIRFDCLLPSPRDTPYGHDGRNAHTYLLLEPGSRERVGEAIARRHEGLELQPLLDVHLDASVTSVQLGTPADLDSLYILATIAAAILLMACINYANLAMALAATRQRELGVRKVLGAGRRQLAIQVWGEAILVSSVACVVGLGLTDLLHSRLAPLAGYELELRYGLPLLAAVAGLALVVGLLAGAYPALCQTQPQPAEIVRGRFAVTSSGRLGKLLIALQFCGAGTFTICAVVMTQQTSLLRHTPLGFDHDGVVVVDFRHVPEGDRSVATLRYVQETRRMPEVVSASRVGPVIARGSVAMVFRHRGQRAELYQYWADGEYLRTLGIDLLEGPGFSQATTSGFEGILVNEAAVALFDLEDPVGRTLPEYRYTDDPALIQGVVADHHFLSLHYGIAPMVVHLTDDQDYSPFVLVRLDPDSTEPGIRSLSALWHRIVPDRPFTYSMMDQDIRRQYEAEQRWFDIVRLATLLAVVIACLGLVGLTSLAVAHRTKEIGIRKVLGSTVTGVTRLLIGGVARLVIIGSATAGAIAFIVMQRWLESFAYRVELGLGTFVATGLALLGLAILTTGVQTLRAAMANPVGALRYE